MSGQSTYQPQSPFMKWMERRLPIASLVYSSFIAYPIPRNLNYWWTFGGILAFMLAVQILTGIVLAMHYTPNVNLAFNSVEAIMRDVNYGWLLRYIHANGASFFFVAVYIHMARGMYYGSYKEPREVLWILGVILFLLMVATGFMGYVLPWGQMSFWAATVITNLFSALPGVGGSVVTWLWGGYASAIQRSTASTRCTTCCRSSSPASWCCTSGRSNGRPEQPTGVEPKTEKDTVAFTPYATAKDAFFIGVFCIFFAWFIFYIPNYLGHSDNYIPGQSGPDAYPHRSRMVLFAVLRHPARRSRASCSGVTALASSIIILAFMPWLDTSRGALGELPPLYRQFLLIFLRSVIGLGYLGSQEPAGGYVLAARLFTAYYFAFFLIILPLLGLIERTKPLPNSISESVLGPGAAAGGTGISGGRP